MKKDKLTVEIGLYLVAFLFAFMLRSINIGVSPLSESEAANAISAFNIANSQVITVGDNFVYVLFTSVLFFIGKSTEFSARIIPAFIGSLIVFTPMLFRHRLGNRQSILLAFCLTIDSGLIAISRQASGEILSIIFLVFAASFYSLRREGPTSIFSALAILSGSGFWYGVFIFGLYFIGLRVATKIGIVQNLTPDRFAAVKTSWIWKKYLISFTVSVLLCGTLFMFYPQGLNSLVSGFTAFVTQILTPSNVPISSLLPILLSFEIFPIVLGISGMVILVIQHHKIDFRWILLLITAVIPVIALPGRQISYFLWINMSFWLLGINAIDKLPSFEKEARIPLFGLVLLNSIAIIFGWMNLNGLFINLAPTDYDFQLRILSVIGAVVLVLLAFILVAWGWSLKIGLLSFFYSLTIMLFMYNTSSNFHISGVGSMQDTEVWSKSSFVDSNLFRATINDYSKWNTGFDNSIEIVVNKNSTNVMHWALRDFENVSYVDALPNKLESEIIITPMEIEVTLDEFYTGQDFIFTKNPLWSGMNTYQWLRWFIKHEVVHETQSIILWVRSDLFPGSGANALP